MDNYSSHSFPIVLRLRLYQQRVYFYLTDIIEITPDEFDRRNDRNEPGIDTGLFRFVQIQWTIDGPIEEVRKANARVIKEAETHEDFIGLSKYLSDLDEFHKNRHKIPE